MSKTVRKALGTGLIVFGIAGVVTGIVPFVANGLRILVERDLWHTVDLMRHGVEAMGLSVEWGMLSAAAGTCLGVLLVCAGTGWRRGRPWAEAVSWCYVLCAVAVNGTDLVIFAARAKPGPMRSWMLLFDGVALLLPICLGIWLITRGSAANRAARNRENQDSLNRA